MSDQLIRIDRRTTLKWLGAALAVSAHHHKALAGTFMPTPGGTGTDPNLNQPAPIAWDRLMTERELRLTAILADLFLPADGDWPAASAIGIHEFIDEWISAPYPEQLSDRPIIREGLARLDGESTRRFGAGFVEARDDQRRQVLDALAAMPDSLFFKRSRNLVVAAYFSSDTGFKEIGYLGNVPLSAFPAPTDEMLAIIDRECKALGV